MSDDGKSRAELRQMTALSRCRLDLQSMATSAREIADLLEDPTLAEHVRGIGAACEVLADGLEMEHVTDEGHVTGVTECVHCGADITETAGRCPDCDGTQGDYHV